MVLLIDNFDSFTYNIYQYLRTLGYEVVVKRNKAVTAAEVESMNPSHIVISPGPGNPDSAGRSSLRGMTTNWCWGCPGTR